MLTYIFLLSLHLIDDQTFWAVSELISFGPEIVTFLGGFRHNFINLVITFLGGLIPGSSIHFLSWRKRFYRDTTVQKINTCAIESCMVDIRETEIFRLSFI